MNRALLSLLIVFAFSFTGKSQNLVPNGDFERYNKCPATLSNIAYSPTYDSFPTVQGWVSPIYPASSDYYNRCAPAGLVSAGVPYNFWGYQPAHSGDGYVGFYTYIDNGGGASTREYVACKLTQPLVAGQKYSIGFYVSTACQKTVQSAVAIDEVGINVSAIPPFNPAARVLSFPYTVRTPAGKFMTDTSKWYYVTDTFRAVGGEEWLSVGCFTQTPAFMSLSGQVRAYPFSYSFIDDVFLIPYSEHIAHFDTLICSPINVFVTITSSAIDANSYHWNTGDSTKTLIARDTGTYWCYANKDGVIFIDTMRVRYVPVAPPLVKDTTVCQNIVAPKIKISGTLYWYAGPNDTASTTTQPVINTEATGVITLYVAAGNSNCKSNKVPVNISVIAAPTVNLGADQLLCDGTDNEMQIAANHQPETNYLWSTGERSYYITASKSANYVLTASNLCGIATDSVQVNFYHCDQCAFIPSAFTPNNDGRNDVFRPTFKCPVTHYQMSIYNRWGQKVYTTTLEQQGWDGRFFGEFADVGTYMYFISFEPIPTGAAQTRKGTVTLVR